MPLNRCFSWAAVAAMATAGWSAVSERGPSWPTEPPSYPLYPGRSLSVLNGTWEFAFLGDVPLLPSVPEPSSWDLVNVPDAFDLRPATVHCTECWPPDTEGEGRCSRCCNREHGHRGDPQCWNAELTYQRCCGESQVYLKRGVGAYRTKVVTESHTAAVLLFAGCSMRCLVAVDGLFLADHAGLSPFTVDVPALTASPQDQELDVVRVRQILVLADNRFNRATHPVHPPEADWYQAGGILRSVQFHSLVSSGPIYIAGVEIFPRSSHEVDVKVRMSQGALSRHDLSLRWRFDDDEPGGRCRVWAAWGELYADAGLVGAEVPRARQWSPAGMPGGPALHRMKVALLGPGGVLLDCTEVRFGLRVVKAQGRHITVNGEPLKLVGFNRHDMTETPVMKYSDLVRDVLLLEAMGSNFVRGSHYAQDQRFLDLCDVRGILVWEEVLSWQPTAANFADGLFMVQSLRMADELVSASINHPCVIFLGFFNEGQSDDDSTTTAAAYAAMASRLRMRSQGTHLISWGSNRGHEDRHLALADVCAFHAYTAWYPTTQPANLDEVQQIPFVWDAYSRWVEENYPNKPLLITEAGAGGLFRHRGPTLEKWTEEYQSLLIQMNLLAALQNPRIAGIALWQFADVVIDSSVSSEHHRPRALNNKGVVSLHREPKLAFEAVRLLRSSQRPREYFGLILPERDAPDLLGKLRI